MPISGPPAPISWEIVMMAMGHPRRNLSLSAVGAIAIRLPLTSSSTYTSSMSEPLAKTSKTPSAASSVASGRAAISRSTSATGIRAISVGAGSVPRRPPVGKAPDLARNRHGPRPGTRGDGRSPTGRHPDSPRGRVAALPDRRGGRLDTDARPGARGAEAATASGQPDLCPASAPAIRRSWLRCRDLEQPAPSPAGTGRVVARLVRPGGVVQVMDLFRPRSVNEARDIVEAAAGDEDQVLRDDFFNSLLAAFSPEEVRHQLAEG